MQLLLCIQTIFSLNNDKYIKDWSDSQYNNRIDFSWDDREDYLINLIFMLEWLTFNKFPNKYIFFCIWTFHYESSPWDDIIITYHVVDKMCNILTHYYFFYKFSI